MQVEYTGLALRYDPNPTFNGYLSKIVDCSGTTEHTRDFFCRAALKRQSLVSG